MHNYFYIKDTKYWDKMRKTWRTSKANILGEIYECQQLIKVLLSDLKSIFRLLDINLRQFILSQYAKTASFHLSNPIYVFSWWINQFGFIYRLSNHVHYVIFILKYPCLTENSIFSRKKVIPSQTRGWASSDRPVNWELWLVHFKWSLS